MSRTLSAALLLALLMFSPQLMAESELELLDGKSLIEKRIAEHFQSLISTNLPSANFEVSASVKLIKNPALEVDQKKSGIPPTSEDVTIGLIQADEVIKSYEDEIAALRQASATHTYPAWFKDYKIKSANLFVGLKKNLDEKVRTEFEKWLKERMTAEFGDAGQVQIMLALDDVKQPNKTFLDQLSQVQNLVGLALVAGALLFALLLWKALASKDAAEERRMRMDFNQKQEAKEAAKKEEPKKPVEVADPSVAQAAKNRAKLLARNIRMLATVLGQQLEKTFAVWQETGEEGYSKLACVLDVLNNAFDDDAPTTTKPSFNYNIPIEHRDGVIGAFKQQQNATVEKSLVALEGAYLDLTAARFFGEMALKQPFTYMSRVSEKAINTILMEQNPRIRSLVMLHMPPQSRKDYLNSINTVEREVLFKEIFSIDQLAGDEIEQANETMKSKFGNVTQSGKSILPLLPGVLSSLAPMDEISILNGLKGSASEVFSEFKRTYLTLAFMDEWPDAQRAMLLSVADYEEVTALIRVAPGMQDKLIASCAPIVARMAQDRLKSADRTNSDEKNIQLEKLRKKLMNLVNTNKITLKDLYEKKPGQPEPGPTLKIAA